jgi:signal transduction histidine kinase/DNA-binding response OmpR family regulator
MKQEVSCRTVQAINQYLTEQHHDTAIVYAAVPHSPAYLAKKNERITWDDFCAIVANLRSIWTDEDFEQLGSRVLQSRSFHGSMTAARLFFDATDLYVWVNRNSTGPGAQLFTCVAATTILLGKAHLSLTLRLTPGHQPCHEFFVITKGAMKVASTLIGLAPSIVEMSEGTDEATYDIRCPEGGGRIAWLRRALAWPKSFRVAATELRDANEALNERYAELEAARDKVTHQATQLKVAYDISQLIRADLDLDSTLQAIAHSLVDVAGFASAAIRVDTVIDDRHIERQTSAGTAHPDATTMNRILEGRGTRIGEMTLTLAGAAGPAHASDLLDYVVPTISMEIDNALSFTILDELRTTLERKVEERTCELRDTNAALKRAQAGRDRLFANISHELRTPLTLILGPLETMVDKSPAGADRQRLTLMKQHSERLLYLINQMLELARLESGDILLHPVRVELAPFLRGITMSYRSLAATRRIDLGFHEAPDRVMLPLDRDKAEMLFNNLLMNAFKFTPDGGRIDVRMWTEGQTVNISVADTGVGIPEADLPHIFDRFYQGGSAERHPTGGTGIGLSLAKELAELHHGSIRVSSIVGTGAVFTVCLPFLQLIPGKDHTITGDEQVPDVALDEDPGLGINADGPRPGLPRGPKHRVLVIDDDADVRSYVSDILGTSTTVVEAVDGDDGVARARDLMPDLVICDVMMPKRDGNDVCRTLKTDVRTSHIPVILLTARAGTESRIEGLETGADDFIVKPFVARELRARVRNLIEVRAALHRRFMAAERIRPDALQLPSREESFLQNAIAVADRHLPDEHFSIEELSREVGLSRSQLHRKLVALTGYSARDFLRRLRLERAHDLLLTDSGTVSEIAYQVGFSDPSHFARCFRRHYGIAPGAARVVSIVASPGK